MTERIAVVLVIAFASGALTSTAAADGKVVVGDFDGPSSSQVRKEVLELLDDNSVDVVPSKKAAATARRTGAELDTESGRVRVARKLRLTAFIEGRVERERRTLKLHVTVYSGRDGMPAGELNLSAPRGVAMRELRATFWDQLGPAITGKVKSDEPEFEIVEPPAEEPQALPPMAVSQQQASDSEQPEASAIAEEDSEQFEDSESESHAAGPALALNVGARFGTRAFQYSDPMPGLRDYNLKVSPNLSLRVQWFPVAHFAGGVWSNFGLDLRGEMLVGVTSVNRTGQKFSTSAAAFGLGLRARLPLEPVELGAIVGYGRHSFGLEETSLSDPDVPDVGYGFVRAGLDFRWQIDPVWLQAQAAFLVGVSHGEISDAPWFPHTSGDGMELELGVGYSLSSILGLELTFAMQRYFMSFDPELDDPGVRGPRRVAGGAVDQYLSSRVGMVLRL